MSEHIEILSQPRKGWFQKTKDDGKPAYKSYRSSCKSGKRGYLGPLHEAHHILPQTSIEESIESSATDKDYLEAVKWITEWNINQPANMVGLPHYHAYDLYYQFQATLETSPGDAPKADALVDWFNKYKLAWRSRWLKIIAHIKPEGWPIHNPVSWGHTQYNRKVKISLQKECWARIDATRKDHALDAATIKSQLESLSAKYFGHLQNRGKGTNKEKWARRHDENDEDWYEPFTMEDCDNPLYG